jgi:prenyltransferase beta subunit
MNLNVVLVSGVEAHGGACYTGIASLALMGRLNALSDEQRTALLSWCERK